MAKLKVKLYSDSGESPREWDNVGTMATKHKNYRIGEETISDPIDWLATKIGYTDRSITMLAKKMNTAYYSEKVKEHLELIFKDKFVVLPLYIYDHSGVSISTTPFGCKWDSMQLGYIFCTKEKVLEEFGGKKVTKKIREKCFSSFVAEVKSYDMWQKGEVYGFNASYGDEEDSCGGFYGTDWENNGILDHLSFEGVSKEKILKKLEKAYSKL